MFLVEQTPIKIVDNRLTFQVLRSVNNI